MPKLRIFSGKEVVDILKANGFSFIRQKGSHVRLVFKKNSESYFLTVPLHSVLDRGTLRSIIKITEKCFPSDVIRNLFYLE